MRERCLYQHQVVHMVNQYKLLKLACKLIQRMGRKLKG